jgi:hypothetical protein
MDFIDKLLDPIKGFVKFFIDKEHKASTRLGIFFLLSVILFFIDFFLGISDNYIQNRKIDNIVKIEKTLASKEIDSLTKIELKKIEKRLISHQGLWERLESWASFTQSNINSPVKKNTEKIPTNIIRSSFFWHTLSSSWLIIFAMIIMPLTLIMDKYHYWTSSEVIGLLAFEIICFFIVLGFSGLFSLIPYFENPSLNYLLNAILHLFSLSLLFWFVQRLSKKIKKT